MNTPEFNIIKLRIDYAWDDKIGRTLPKTIGDIALRYNTVINSIVDGISSMPIYDNYSLSYEQVTY